MDQSSGGEGKQHLRHKRKADSQENERLSKRLSLLNIEQDGTQIYVPVEKPRVKPLSSIKEGTQQPANDTMHLDDTKHKVYIYNIDDELSSDSEDEGKMVFLPDIEKRLRENRIPKSILANQDGEITGMQVVLYSDPKSLTVPEEKDGVRRAIIEARKRLREQQSSNSKSSTAETCLNSKNEPASNESMDVD